MHETTPADERIRQLAATERLFEDLIESIDGIVCEVDARSFQITFVSRQAERILGYPRSYWLGSPTFWIDHIHPADREHTVAATRVAIESRTNLKLEYRMMAADGSIVWLSDVVSVVLHDGECTRLRGVKVDITDRKRVEEQLIASNQQIYAMHASLQRAREDERARIARELHDALGSMLTGLKWELEAVAAPRGADEAPAGEDRLSAATRLVDDTINTVRRIASELRPAVLDLGLSEAVRWQVQQFQERSGIATDVEIALDKEPAPALAVTVFRILQEAMTNILRHAGATRVDVRLEQRGDELLLSVRDNGIGIPDAALAATTVGLSGMRERAYLVAGSVEIARTEEGGTIVCARVPITRQT